MSNVRTIAEQIEFFRDREGRITIGWETATQDLRVSVEMDRDGRCVWLERRAPPVFLKNAAFDDPLGFVVAEAIHSIMTSPVKESYA